MTKSYKERRRARGVAVFDELWRRGALLREPTDDELDHFGDSCLYGDIEGQQELQWIRSSVHYTERVALGGATAAEFSLFWIRVAGVLLDIAPKHRASMDLGKKLLGDLSASPAHVMTQSLLDAIARIPNALEEDELYYLEYRRHVECHPHQSAYRAQLRKDGTLKSVPSKALGDERDQADSEDTLGEVLKRYALNEDEIAVSVAKSLIEPFRAVEKAAVPLYTQREWDSDK